MTLESQITSIAQGLQIDALGFVPLTQVHSSTQQIYSDWIAEGKHGSMDYLQNYLPQRFNPQSLLEGAQSAIIIACSYYPTTPQPPTAPQIAKYALGRDYHKVLPKLLTELGQKIHQEVAPHRFRALVDTAPFLERYWAEQASLGFIGRHHNLIIPKVGSFVFLGELLTTLELQSQLLTFRGCGKCQRCIQACPTGALSDGSLDARKCINYLTIEHRGEMDAHLSAQFGKRLYGCDTCQDVCPYNHRPSPTRLFSAAPQLLQISAKELTHFTEESYARFFYGTACTRAKFQGMARNAQIFLQNNPTSSANSSSDQ